MKKVLILFCILFLFTGCQNNDIKIMVYKDAYDVVEIDKNEYDVVTNLTKRLEFYNISKENDSRKCRELYINENGIVSCYWIYDDGKIKYKNVETYNVEIAKKLCWIIERTYKQKGVYNK